MTARFFGEFLVQKKTIKPEVLVSALLEQMGRLPMVSQVLFDQGMLSAETVLKVFHYQQQEGLEFTMACQSMDLWGPDFDTAIEEKLKKVRVPVGQILVQRGDIDLSTLTKMLDEYLAQAEVINAEPEVKDTVEEVVTATGVPATGAPAAAVAATYETFQPGIITEVEEMFDERKKRAVKAALAFIKDKTPLDHAMTTKLMNDSLKIVRTVMGLVTIFGLTSLQALFDEMERILELRLHASAFSPEQMQEVATAVSAAIDEAWALRESLSKNYSDGMYMNDKHTFARYTDILKTMREIQ